MIKVLIVDDERLVRIGVRSSLQWEDHGFTVVGEACNGEEALGQIRSLQPDLVLTDIRMPKMDGIQLLSEIEKQSLPVETVIMSCYNEFELVRAAMRHGASDYILKLSVSDQEMLEVLDRSRHKILDRQKKQEAGTVLADTDFREKFIKSVLDPATPSSKFELLLKQLHIPLDIHNMSLLLFSIDPSFDSSCLCHSMPDRKTAILLLNLLHDDLTRQNLGEAFLLDEGKERFLVCLNPGLVPDAIANDIQKKARAFFNLSLSIGIMDYDFCKTQYFSFVQQAIAILEEKKFFLGRGCRFHLALSDTVQPQQFSAPDTGFLENANGLEDLNKLLYVIENLCKTMPHCHSSKSACLVIFTEIFYKVAGLLHSYGGSIDKLNKKYDINFSASLQNLSFLPDAPAWFHTYFSFIDNYLTLCTENRKRNDILTALSYINKNYNLPISAQKVAHLVGISEAYFSTLFKRETGNGFNEYLTNLRMDKAKALLKDKNIFIYEVCEYVGYTDANYFGKVFKKHSGLSPEAYRKSQLSSK